jgi:hypothetical protein
VSTPSWSVSFERAAAAPAPPDFTQLAPEEALARDLDQRRAARRAAIDAIEWDHRSSGKPIDRMTATVLHDTARAPIASNRMQLARIGVRAPSADEDFESRDEAWCREELWRIVYGLASIGVFLLGTDGLDDRGLLAFLSRKVLDEEVRDIPPDDSMSEFIDLTAVGGPGGPPSGGGRDALLPRPLRGSVQ